MASDRTPAVWRSIGRDDEALCGYVFNEATEDSLQSRSSLLVLDDDGEKKKVSLRVVVVVLLLLCIIL